MVAKKILLNLDGADTQNRTGDLILTKDALYRLSHISTQNLCPLGLKKPVLQTGSFNCCLHLLKRQKPKLKPGDVLLSHGEAPHYHRR